jgi:hypothetical protein
MTDHGANTATEYRRTRGSEIPVTLSTGHVFLCRRPDMDDAMFRGALPLPLVKAFFVGFAKVALAAAATPDGLQAEAEHFLENGQGREAIPMIETWVCLAARSPRVVMVEEDANPGAGVLWVGDLDLADKVAIFSATFTRAEGEAARRAAAEAFPAGLDGAGAGHDGAPVPDPPVVDVEHR